MKYVGDYLSIQKIRFFNPFLYYIFVLFYGVKKDAECCGVFHYC